MVSQVNTLKKKWKKKLKLRYLQLCVLKLLVKKKNINTPLIIMICCKNKLTEKKAMNFLLPWMFCKAMIKSLTVYQSLQLSVLLIN